MESESTIIHLKKQLRHEVELFCSSDRRMWKHPVVQILRALQYVDARAVLFGGTLRSLLYSRLTKNRPGRPRDIDIVVDVASIDAIRDRFHSLVTRETRFGGLQLKHGNWQFDIWPMAKTCAFVQDNTPNPEFAMLPETTFFNLEAVAIELWPTPGYEREIFSGNDQFFDGLSNKTLDINREENPFPVLCIVRGLVMASALGFQISPRLARYIQQRGEKLTEKDLGDIQFSHYKNERKMPFHLKNWIEFISDRICKSPDDCVTLPENQQLTFWPES